MREASRPSYTSCRLEFNADDCFPFSPSTEYSHNFRFEQLQSLGLKKEQTPRF
jgi:hypothetical protein